MSAIYGQSELDTAIENVMIVQHKVNEVDIGAVQEALSNMRKADAIMPIVEPTLYRSRMMANRDNQRCLEAFVAYRTALESIISDMQARS